MPKKQRHGPANSQTALPSTNLAANATCMLTRTAHALRIQENVPNAKRARPLGQHVHGHTQFCGQM